MFINVAFVVAVVMSLVLLRYVRRSARAANCTPQRAVLFVRGLLELTIPFAIAAGVFAVLQLRLARMTVTSATTTIGRIESVIAELRTVYLKELNPPAWLQLVCVLIFFAGGVMWPQVRAAMLMQKYKTATQWLARAYVFVTLLASFTFFGGQHVNGVTAAEARLMTDAAEIRLAYADAYRELEDAMWRSAVAAAIDHPDIGTQADKASTVVREAIRERMETHNARAEIERIARNEVRDFEVPRLEENARQENASRSEPPIRKQPPAVDESRWSRAGGDATLRDVKEARSAARLDRPELTIVAETAVDALHDHGGKAVLAAFIGDGPMRALLEVAIDPAVLHNFRDVVAAKLNEAWRDIAAGGNAKAVFARKTAETRAQVSTLAKRSATGIATAIDNAAALWRGRADKAAEMHAAASRDLNARAEAQYRREAAAFARLYRATYRFPSAEVTTPAEHLLDGVLQEVRAKDDPLDRVAALRDMRTRLTLEEGKAADAEAVVRLVNLEKERGEVHSFHDALSPAVYDVLRTHDESEWGRLRTAAHEEFRSKSDAEGVALHSITDRWEDAKQRRAIAAFLTGETLSAEAWERAFYRHCLNDAEAAVIWGWVVKDTHSVAIAAAYERVVPQNGFRHYLESSGLGTEATAAAVFSTPVAIRTINRFCTPTGQASSNASGAPPWPSRPRTKSYRPPRPRPRARGR